MIVVLIATGYRRRGIDLIVKILLVAPLVISVMVSGDKLKAKNNDIPAHETFQKAIQEMVLGIFLEDFLMHAIHSRPSTIAIGRRHVLLRLITGKRDPALDLMTISTEEVAILCPLLAQLIVMHAT